jgi:hypothetical protein
MKLHQNRVDRFSVIAKKLVDEHSAELFKDSTRLMDNYDIYRNHLDKLGQQLEDYASDFLSSCQVQNDQLKNDIWNTCSKYLDLFAKRNQPGQYKQFI